MAENEPGTSRVPFEGLHFDDASGTVVRGRLIVMDDRGELHSAPFTPHAGHAEVHAEELGNPTNVVFITLETTPRREIFGPFGRNPHHAGVRKVFRGRAMAFADGDHHILGCNQVELRTD